MHSTHRRTRATHRGARLDVMRPSQAFSVSRTSRLDDPARWLRTTLLVVASLAALTVLLGSGTR